VNEVTDSSPVAVFFGEDQGRYLLTVQRDLLDDIEDLARAANVFCPWIGNTGGSELKLGSARAISVAELTEAHETWFPAYMAGG
jgi:phosphoribosylformylglycinamidine synthase